MALQRKEGFATTALHTTVPKWQLDATPSLVPPIMTASTYAIPADHELTDKSRMLYGRYGCATRNTLEATIAKMERAMHSAVFSSGMAAVNAVVEGLLCQGDHIVASKQMYGGVYNLFAKDLPKVGITSTLIVKSDADKIVQALTKKTKLVWLEVCSNPIMDIADLKLIVEKVKSFDKDIVVAVDNTYLSPYIIQPLAFGVDLVMHSCTKFMGGHSDIVMGCVSGNRDDLFDELRRIQFQRGATPSSFDCYLLQRSLYTLEIRMQKHHDSALKIAHFLEKHPGVEGVLHPLLESHPGHKLALTQHQGLHSGMLSIYVKGGAEAAMAFLSNLKLVHCAVSLGGAHSLATYPTKLSHSFFTEAERVELGIRDNLIRISIGLETPEDIMSDFDQALVLATGLGPLGQL